MTALALIQHAVEGSYQVPKTAAYNCVRVDPSQLLSTGCSVFWHAQNSEEVALIGEIGLDMSDARQLQLLRVFATA